MEQNFNELLEKSLLDFKYKEGQIIKGTVLSIVNDTVVVDVGLKSEGRIPIKEFHSPGEEHYVKVGEKYDVYLEKLENKATNLEESVENYNRVVQLNNHIQNQFKKKAKEIQKSIIFKKKKKWKRFYSKLWIIFQKNFI